MEHVRGAPWRGYGRLCRGGHARSSGGSSVLGDHVLVPVRVGAAVVAIAMTMVIGSATRASHPPAAATTLLVALGAIATIDRAIPVFAGVVTITIAGEAFRQTRSHRMAPSERFAPPRLRHRSTAPPRLGPHPAGPGAVQRLVTADLRRCGRASVPSTGSTTRSSSSTRPASPTSSSCLRVTALDPLIDAIARLAVRGAPALGVAGALGVALLARHARRRRGRGPRGCRPAPRRPTDRRQPRLGRGPRAGPPRRRAGGRPRGGARDPRRGHRRLRGHRGPRRGPRRGARRPAPDPGDDDLQHRARSRRSSAGPRSA